ncbi:hypothetical protein BaRGS_00016398, partial [Batillaria attramentaria]
HTTHSSLEADACRQQTSGGTTKDKIVVPSENSSSCFVRPDGSLWVLATADYRSRLDTLHAHRISTANLPLSLVARFSRLFFDASLGAGVDFSLGWL